MARTKSRGKPMPRCLPIRFLLALLTASLPATAWSQSQGARGKDVVLPAGVPAKVARVLRQVDRTGKAPSGYVGGRHFGNFENRLPKDDARGRSIKYQEWDVNPKISGKNRGPERLVTGSDGAAY